MQCLLCHEKIPRLRSWTTKSEFCCDEHGAMYKKQTLERLLTEQTSSSSSQAAEPVNPFFVPTAQSTTAVDTLESENVAPALEFDDSFGDAHGEPPVAAPNVEPLPPIEPSGAAGQFSQEPAQSLESLGKSAAETEPDWGDPERALEELWKSTGGLDPISPDSGSYEVGLSESADLYNLTGPAAHLDIPLVLTCESKAFNCKMLVWQDRQR